MEADTAVLDLHPRVLWRALTRQSRAFWALNLYLMIEYVRPQSVWPVIDVIPWGQVALLLALVTALSEPPVRRRFHVIDGLLTLFTVVVLASLVGAYRPAAGFSQLSIFVNWVVLYYLTTRVVTNEVRLFLFFGAFCLWSLKMSQHGARSFVSVGFGFRDWGATGGPGWFHNSGEFAIQMCIFLALGLHVVVGLRHRWSKWKTVFMLFLIPGTAFVSLIASSSRGGQLGGAIVLLFTVVQSRHRIRGLVLAGLVLPLLWFIVPPEQKVRFTQMGDDNSSETRFTYWRHGREIMADYPLLGVGYKNWLPYYRRYYDPTGQVPHNIFIEAGAEMGYLGLISFVLLIGATFAVNARTRRMARMLPNWQPFYRSFAFGLDAALVGYLVTGFFVTVLFYPFFWMNLSFTSALYVLVERKCAAVRTLQRNVARQSHQERVRKMLLLPT